MRRPASRRPPKLPDVVEPTPTPSSEKAPPSARQQLRNQHVVGAHARLGREELRARLRRVANGDPEALLGLAPFADPPVDIEMMLDVLARRLGYEERGANVVIDPDVAIAAMANAVERIRAVARHDGRIAVATSRPASMLGVMQALACVAEIDGGTVLGMTRTTPFKIDGRSNRHLWWYGGVAAVSDGTSVIPVRRSDAAEEWLFLLGRPDLVIADGPFAGVALANGIETVAFADLDDAALALAAEAGLPVSLVPVDTGRPPMAYAPLLATALAPAVPAGS